MKNDILIVPDVHGRDFWLPALDYQGEVIFLGDFTDPYPQENFSEGHAYDGMKKIIEFKKQNPDRVTLLIGNHEMHYYHHKFACGRFNYDYFQSYNQLLTSEENKDLFRICKEVDNYLFIHAGLTKNWYDRHLADFDDLGDTLDEKLTNAFFTKMEIFHEAAIEWRGGNHESGSPLWTDYREFAGEKEHFGNGIIQIIGHTQILEPDPIIQDNFCMLDNRQLYILRESGIEKYQV